MEKVRRFNRWLIAFVIILQPALDMLRKLVGADFEVFGFSLLELVNIVLIGTIFLLTVITYPEKKKLLKWLWLLVPYLVYFIVHYYNITQFNNSVYPDQTVSIVTEFYYLFRVFMLPLVLIFSIYYSGIQKKEIFQIFELFILIMAGSIILLNLLKLSFFTYDNGVLAGYSILDWLSFDGPNYQKIATKGWFFSGNQISAILFICLPITLFLAYNKETKYNYFLLGIHVLSMLMLGTKVANFGCVLVLICFIIIIIFKKLILKKDIMPIKIIVAIMLCVSALFCFSPRGYELRSGHTEVNDGAGKSPIISVDTNKKISELNCPYLSHDDKMFLDLFIYKNVDKLKFPSYFLNAYPLEYNYNYWCYMVKNAVLLKSNVIDYRSMKTSMLNQIYINNDNWLDKYVGMGYTLNFIYTEEDYTYQFYNYGIFGILLFIGPYLLILLVISFKFLKGFKNNFTVQNTLFIIALAFGILVPYMSGHVFERSFPLYVLALIAAINLLNLKEFTFSKKIENK